LGYCSSTDVDVFFPNRFHYNKAVEAFQYWIENEIPGRRIFKSNLTEVYSVRKHKIQLVGQHFFTSPQETISMFDFTVCCAAVDKNQLYTHETFFMDLAGRKLVINRLPFPLSTMQRMQRYIKKGYTICNGGLLEIAEAIQEIDLTDPNANTLEFYPDGTPRFMRID
jgi:hypothetical protein